VSSPETLCPMCLTVRRLSGEKKCAIHVKADFLAAHHPEFDLKSIAGSSPPGVFVGRFGYPNVSVGPMVPSISGDTEILDTPEWWMGKGFDEIVDFRYSLLRGYSKAKVSDAQKGGRLIETLQDVAMMTKACPDAVEHNGGRQQPQPQANVPSKTPSCHRRVPSLQVHVS